MLYLLVSQTNRIPSRKKLLSSPTFILQQLVLLLIGLAVRMHHSECVLLFTSRLTASKVEKIAHFIASVLILLLLASLIHCQVLFCLTTASCNIDIYVLQSLVTVHANVVLLTTVWQSKHSIGFSRYYTVLGDNIPITH